MEDQWMWKHGPQCNQRKIVFSEEWPQFNQTGPPLLAKCKSETKGRLLTHQQPVGETSSSQSYDDIDGFKSSHVVKSAGDSEEITRGPDYVSYVRTVALWVCTAETFGVGFGLKDGVGRAYEFFAGCEHDPLY